jgi:glycosyltransferase involved in cell wall biosynthesis
MQADFSVVMPARNAEATLARAVNSVIAQSFGSWELLIVDDGSSDRTRQMAEEFATRDPRIRLVVSEVNLGIAGARNLALENARGNYIAFLDADDYWYPQKLEKQRACFASGARVVFSSFHRVLPDGTRTLVRARKRAVSKTFHWCNPIGNSTGAYDRNAIGIVRLKRVRHEDYLMWYQVVTKAGSAIGIPEPLSCYCVGSGSISGNKLQSATWVWHMLRREFRLPVYRAAAGFTYYALRALAHRVKRA